MNPLIELTLRRSKGRVVKWLRLVKQPKYFIGLGIGLAYYGWIVFGRILSSGPRSGLPFDASASDETAALRLVAAAAVAAFLTIVFLLPSRQPLTFDESEIQYLFTSPLSRRSLIRYALLKFQPGILFGSFVSVMLVGRGDLLDRALRWPSVWALFTLWFLWSTASGLWKARTAELPSKVALKRRLMGWGVVAAYWGAIVLFARATWISAQVAVSIPETGRDLPAAARGVAAAVQGSIPLTLLLAPFETPFLALWPTSGLERAIGWGALALLVAALSEFCARSPLLFEDAVIERAQRISDLRANGRGANRKKASPRARKLQPFALRPSGWSALAVIWKNLAMVRRRPLAHSAAWAAGTLMLILALSVGFGAPVFVLTLCLIVGCSVTGLVALSAGAAWRNDLRIDLLHVDQLRTWPIDSRSLIAAEVASPAISGAFWIATGLGLAAIAPASALLAGALGLATDTPEALRNILAALGVSGWGIVIFGTLAVFIVTCALTLLSCALQNASVLLFPGWARLGPQRPQGAAIAGQQVLLGVGRLIVLGVGMIPGALVVGLFGIAHVAWELPFYSVELPFFALILAVPLVAEATLLVLYCARLWDRMDPSRDLLEPSSG